MGWHRRVPVTKRLEGGQFRWPPFEDGVMRLRPAQLAALLRRDRVGRRRGARGRASEGGVMTLLTAFAAITACGFSEGLAPSTATGRLRRRERCCSAAAN